MASERPEYNIIEKMQARAGELRELGNNDGADTLDECVNAMTYFKAWMDQYCEAKCKFMIDAEEWRNRAHRAESAGSQALAAIHATRERLRTDYEAEGATAEDVIQEADEMLTRVLKEVDCG